MSVLSAGALTMNFVVYVHVSGQGPSDQHRKETSQFHQFEAFLDYI